MSLFKWCKRWFETGPKNRDDLLTTIRNAEQEHILDSQSEGMLEGVLQVSEMQIRDIMIPKANIISIDKHLPLADIIGILIEAEHSRYPVMDNDKVIGIMLAKDLLRFVDAEQHKSFSLKNIIQPVLIVPETQHLDRLLRTFKSRRSHMAIVVDEFGHIAGLVTMEDVLEQIVGDIEDESDYDEDDSIKQYGDYYIVKADVSLSDLSESLEESFEDEECESIGGLISKQFGYIPKRNETTIINNFVFRVLHADSRRIRLLQVRLEHSSG